jgi:hypothetical protein
VTETAFSCGDSRSVIPVDYHVIAQKNPFPCIAALRMRTGAFCSRPARTQASSAPVAWPHRGFSPGHWFTISPAQAQRIRENPRTFPDRRAPRGRRTLEKRDSCRSHLVAYTADRTHNPPIMRTSQAPEWMICAQALILGGRGHVDHGRDSQAASAPARRPARGARRAPRRGWGAPPGPGPALPGQGRKSQNRPPGAGHAVEVVITIRCTRSTHPLTIRGA